MKLRNLEIFVGVMEAGSLAKAAGRLNTSQPAASRLIKLLEEELGVSLFERRSKRLIPTPQAVHFLPEAHRILALVSGIPSYLALMAEGDRTPYRVVCHMRIADSLVVPALVKLSRQHPELRIQMDIQPRQNLERLLMQEQFDTGVGVLPFTASRLLREILCEPELAVYVSTSHPLADRQVVSLSDLAPYDYVGLPKHAVVRSIIDGLPDIAKNSLVPVHEFSNSNSAHHYVAATTSYTFTDELSVSARLRDSLVRVPFSTTRKVRYGLFGKRGSMRHAADDAFLQCVLDVISEIHDC